MDNRFIFREMLTQIKHAADASGNRISKEEVREVLKNMPLEEEHLEMIYSYLSEQNIQVIDSKEELEEYPEEKEQQSLSLYVEEMERLEQRLSKEEQVVMERVMCGDEDAKSDLIHMYLPVICSMADGYEGEGLPVEDLIQEGNMGLLLALDALSSFESAAACRAHIVNCVNAAMDQAMKEYEASSKMNQGIVNRVNHLNEAVNNLERDLEHKVSPEELSAYLDMPLEEIKDILRMSGDQIEVENKGE